MKLSLAWIFDHIDVKPDTWQQFDVAMIAQRFNNVTAEIEHVNKRVVDLKRFFLVFKHNDAWLVDETGDTAVLPARPASEAVYEKNDSVAYLVKKNDAGYAWAILSDFGTESDRLAPAVHAPQPMRSGAWKKLWDAQDYIIEVDNKSITHRPDMWGHRGFAREIAPFVGSKIKAAHHYIQNHPVARVDQAATSVSVKSAFSIKNEAVDACSVFNALYITDIANKPCDLKILGRLLSVGAMPHNALVDLTNYVALDWGQPVHAYDAQRIANKTVKIRKATAGEELLLLDGNSITLAAEDLVIADDRVPMCLAGVKGGSESSVSNSTTSILFEAANFEASTVRRAALRHKTRTDSSSRFEKTLDPNHALEAVQRFLFLMQEIGLSCTPESSIISLGKHVQPLMITVEHAFLEKRMGIAIKPSHVAALLENIEFGVVFDAATQAYNITVPTFRSSKDIDCKEDILEEVVRTNGFDKIPLIMPTLTRQPFALTPVMRHREIKLFLTQVMKATETQNYAFFDEAFLQSINLEQPAVVELVNPVSENFKRLVSSLVPGLLKNILDNQVHRDEMRLFESARVWRDVDGEVVEHKSIAICQLIKRAVTDFYEMKEMLSNLLISLGVARDLIEWKQVTNPTSAWYKPYQTATISVAGQQIGIMGKANPLLLARLGMAEQVDAIFSELNLDTLLTLQVPTKRFTSLPRFQETFLDFSFMVPLTLHTATLEQELKKVSPLVSRVQLLDFFEKESWDNQRSLTFRAWLLDLDGTVDKATLDNVQHAVVTHMNQFGAQLRAA